MLEQSINEKKTFLPGFLFIETSPSVDPLQLKKINLIAGLSYQRQVYIHSKNKILF